MASRDKSQRVGFVYTNIYEIYKKAQNTEAAKTITSDTRVFRADDLANLKVTKFEPRTLARVTPANAATAIPAGPNGANPFEDLKSNLSRLQDLHSRLRFMLKELEDLVEKK